MLMENYSKQCAVLCLVAQSCPTLCDPLGCSPPGSSVHGDSPGKNTGVGCHAFLQGICQTQGSNPDLPHYRQTHYCLSHNMSLYYFFLIVQVKALSIDIPYWRRKWQPTPVFLPGESQRRGSLVGCHLWGRTESDTTEATQQQQQQQCYVGFLLQAAETHTGYLN